MDFYSFQLRWFKLNRLIKLILFSLVLLITNVVLADTFKSTCLNTYLSPGKYGPRFYLDSTNISEKSLAEQLPTLKVMSQNVENLGAFAEHRVDTVLVNGQQIKKEINFTMVKTENSKQRLAERIEIVNPDIIVATEVQNIKEASDYSRDYLGNKYQAILIQGNDSRGINICYFIKRTLNLDFEVESHKEYPSHVVQQPGMPPIPMFSRDFTVLKIREAGASKQSQPLMAIFGTHLKSQMGGGDGKPGSIDKTAKKRGEQVLATMEILSSFEKQSPGTPYIVAGDHNKDVHTAPEFQPYFSGGLEDTMTIASDSPPVDQRFTQYYQPEGADHHLVKMSQLDMVLANSSIRGYVVSSTIQRDVLPDGTPVPLPETGKQINRRASDHDGLVVIFDFAKLIRDRAVQH